MLLRLKSLFMGDVDSLPIDCTLDFSGLELAGSYPFQLPVQVHGEVSQSAGIVTLRAKVSYRYDGQCDRCTTPFQHTADMHMEHILVTSLSNEDNDDFVLLEDYALPLDELVEADLILELPSKNLCREDCRGLCPMCGKNLNEGLCGCQSNKTDPRFEVLRQLIR